MSSIESGRGHEKASDHMAAHGDWLSKMDKPILKGLSLLSLGALFVALTPLLAGIFGPPYFLSALTGLSPATAGAAALGGAGAAVGSKFGIGKSEKKPDTHGKPAEKKSDAHDHGGH